MLEMIFKSCCEPVIFQIFAASESAAGLVEHRLLLCSQDSYSEGEGTVVSISESFWSQDHTLWSNNADIANLEGACFNGIQASDWFLNYLEHSLTVWVNMVEKLCIHVWKWKNETCWNHSKKGGRDKGEWWRGWIQVWYIVETFVNVTIQAQHNNNKIKKRVTLIPKLLLLKI
jgi:hypothetical protein